jgi:hypothetical protein
MMRDYLKGYSHLVSVTNYPLLIISLSLATLASVIPYVVASLNVLWLLFVPDIYGGFILLFGLVTAVLLYQRTSSPAGKEFPLHRPNQFTAIINQLNRTPGVSWAGIEIQIGEAMGYYTIRDPKAVARIEGIEGVAKIEVKLNKDGEAVSAISDVQFEDSAQERKLEVEFNQVGGIEVGLQMLTRWTLEAYVTEMGSNEILDEILAEVPSIESKRHSSKEIDDLMTAEDNSDGTGEESVS